MSSKSVGVIGAGPAGLTAAYLLAKQGVEVTVLEADPVYVGGLARTAQYKGFRFDIGGPPLFFKSKEIEKFLAGPPPDATLRAGRAPPSLYPGQIFSH